MLDEENTKTENVGEMHKRREIMADGKRYLIYYTFGASQEITTSQAKPLTDEAKS